MHLFMKMLSILIVLSFTLPLAGCAPRTAKFDYDSQTDFSRLNSFRWKPIPGDMQIDELTETRIKNAVNRELACKRFMIVPSNPDLLISLHLKRQIKKQMVNWGYPYIPDEGSWGGRIIDSYKYEEGTLVLDFIDTRTERVRWTGSITLIIEPRISPKKRTERINEAVSKILENFPPT